MVSRRSKLLSVGQNLSHSQPNQKSCEFNNYCVWNSDYCIESNDNWESSTYSINVRFNNDQGKIKNQSVNLSNNSKIGTFNLKYERLIGDILLIFFL